jgi:hypothetical protein
MRTRIRDQEICPTLDPGYGMEKMRIRDKHPRSATLFIVLTQAYCAGGGGPGRAAVRARHPPKLPHGDRAGNPFPHPSQGSCRQ